MSVYDKLFQLQLRLKQNKVNQQRKRDEVKRLCQSYENQVYHLLYLLYSFSSHTWYQINQSNEFFSTIKSTISNNGTSSTQKDDGNFSEILLNISNIPTEPENKTNFKNVLNISDELSMLSSDLKTFINSKLNDNSSDSIFSIPIEAFLLILTLFNFFWSQESSDLFTYFIKDLDPKNAIKYIQCLIVHPSIQMYFISALRPIFNQISKIHDYQNENMKQALLDSLLEFSPLIPNFLKTIFAGLDISDDEKSKVFYETFLRNYLVNFSAFGIFPSEIILFYKDRMVSLINSLDEYFNNKDSQDKSQVSSEKFLKSLFSSTKSICIVPNEERLINTSKGYCPATLVDKRSYEFIHSHSSPLAETQLEGPPKQIPTLPIFYVPHSPVQPNLSTRIASRFITDSAVNIASRILLKSDLIHIEDFENKTQSNPNPNANQNSEKVDDDIENPIPVVFIESNSMKPFEYFEKIVDLSFSRVADPQVEVDLDKLEPLVQDMTLEELCQLIETELSMIEISSNTVTNDDNNNHSFFGNADQDEDIVSTLTSATSASDPLLRISQYSTQFSLINKINSFVQSQISSSTNAANFLLVNKYVSNYVDRNPPEKNIFESNHFNIYYKTAFDDMMKLNSQNETANFLSNPNSISSDNIKLVNTTNNNNNTNTTRVANSTNNLRPLHDRSKIWSNIQPDFVTHRNFHSSLSFKLDLFNKIKNEKEVIEEAARMKKFLFENKEKLTDTSQHKFLEIFIQEPHRLKYFNEEFEIAFSSNMPFIRIDHIHQAYQALIGLLQIQGMDEIGADQITPFAMAATVLLVTNTKTTSDHDEYVYELTYTYKYLFRYVEPFISNYNVLNHSEEYSLIQFLSTYQYLYQTMKESENK